MFIVADIALFVCNNVPLNAVLAEQKLTFSFWSLHQVVYTVVLVEAEGGVSSLTLFSFSQVRKGGGKTLNTQFINTFDTKDCTFAQICSLQ